MSSCSDKIQWKMWLPKQYYQWQRKKFAGTENELTAFLFEWDKANIRNDLAQRKIVWKFNTPGAPHFGGVWERLIESCKKVLIATLDNRSLTDKVFIFTMCLIEQTLNRRSLTTVSDDPEDWTVLPPNQFLLGRENASAPFKPSSERYHDRKKSFKSVQEYVVMIWKNWLANIFHNGTRDWSGQKNMCEIWKKVNLHG